jgi:hypothetical protein
MDWLLQQEEGLVIYILASILDVDIKEGKLVPDQNIEQWIFAVLNDRAGREKAITHSSEPAMPLSVVKQAEGRPSEEDIREEDRLLSNAHLIPFDVETYLDIEPEQQELIKSNKPLEFGPGLLYLGVDNFDTILANGVIPGGILLTRAAHQYAAGRFEKTSPNPAILVISTDLFNRLLLEGKASMGNDDRSRGFFDPSIRIHCPLCLDDIEEVWIDIETDDRYAKILQNPSTDSLKSMKGKLVELLKKDKIKMIPWLRHSRISRVGDIRALKAVGLYMMTRELFGQIPRFREMGTSEQAHAITFAKEIDQKPKDDFIAISTSWITGYEKDKYLQYEALNPLFSSLRSFCEKHGIEFIEGDDEAVTHRVEAIRQSNPKARGRVLVGKDIIEKLNLRSNENVIIAGVDNSNLTIDSYISLMEMLNLMRDLSLGRQVKTSIDITPITDQSGAILYYIFTPKAEPMDYEKLEHIYKLQMFA